MVCNDGAMGLSFGHWFERGCFIGLFLFFRQLS